MNPIEKEALKEKMMNNPLMVDYIMKMMNNPLMVDYLMPPQYTIETYPTGQEKRRTRRKQERKGKKK